MKGALSECQLAGSVIARWASVGNTRQHPSCVPKRKNPSLPEEVGHISGEDEAFPRLRGCPAPFLRLRLTGISATNQAYYDQLKLRSLQIKQAHKEKHYVRLMIDDKSCFKGRPFLTAKGAAKGKKSRSSPFLQLQENLSVKFYKTRPYVRIFWRCLGQEFPNGSVCATESIYRHLGVGKDAAQTRICYHCQYKKVQESLNEEFHSGFKSKTLA